MRRTYVAIASSSGRRYEKSLADARRDLEESRLIAGILTANERKGSGALAMARRRSSKPELLDLWSELAVEINHA